MAELCDRHAPGQILIYNSELPWISSVTCEFYFCHLAHPFLQDEPYQTCSEFAERTNRYCLFSELTLSLNILSLTYFAYTGFISQKLAHLDDDLDSLISLNSWVSIPPFNFRMNYSDLFWSLWRQTEYCLLFWSFYDVLFLWRLNWPLLSFRCL